MTCIKPELIQKYIDNEVTAIGKVFVEEHLANCETCRHKVESRRRFAQLIVNSVNDMVKVSNDVPAFVPVRKVESGIFFQTRKIIWGLSAACVLLAILLTVMENRTGDTMNIKIINTIGPEVDANKPVAQQDMIIQVIDQNGNVTELIME